MWFFLFFSLFAFAREIDPSGPGPGRPPRCYAEQMRRCEQEHRDARDRSFARASELASEIQLVREESRRHESARADIENLRRLIAENERLGEREADHLFRLLAPEKQNADLRPFSDSPSLTQIFSLTESHVDWQEVSPSERLSRLNRSLQAWAEERELLKTRETEILLRIQSLAHKTSSLEASKSSHLEAAREHGRMCDSGCRERFCPEG